MRPAGRITGEQGLMFEQSLAAYLFRTLENAPRGAITITCPDGVSRHFGGGAPGAEAEITILDWRAVRMSALRGDIGLAEAYRDGLWRSPDLAALFAWGLQNEDALGSFAFSNALSRFLTRLGYLFTRNTMSGSRRNIHAHYDIGNEFYKLWLDPGMTYSAALFSDESQSLEAAQTAKYDRIINRLHGSGDLLEIGCGWGGFAERALERGDYGVRGLTISDQQYDYAKARLEGRAQIMREDYRLQTGRFGQIVSIEMFEAVGQQFWPLYFGKVKALLAEKGRAVIQTITIEDSYFNRYAEAGDPIRTFIFPGGLLPSPERFGAAAKEAGLSVTDRFAFGDGYARTLRLWLARFEDNLEAIRALGLDERFIRMWRFYLTYCIAGFEEGRTNVMQMELRHAA